MEVLSPSKLRAIKSEDTFLIKYVLLDKKDGYTEVDIVEESALVL